MERYSKKLVVLVFTLIFLVIGLGTYIYVDKFVLTEDTCACETDNKSIIKDNTKSIVYNNPNYSNIKIPYLNIDSIDAGKINKELEEFYTDTLKIKDKPNLEDAKLYYNYYSNSNILSIICYCNFISAVNYYKSANINIKTGTRVENEDLILTAGVNKDEFINTLIKIYDDSIDQEQESYIKSTKPYGEDVTIYDKNINNFKNKTINQYEMYLNNNGELCVIVEEYQIAGAEINRKVMNINKKTYEKITE